MKQLFLFLLLCLCGTICAEVAPPPPRPLKLLGHYMQWFEYRQENGMDRRFHWEWKGKTKQHDPARFSSNQTRDIYSVLYPRIGIYDSTDPVVMDYHILSAKSAGISVFTVDWYGPGPDRKFEQLLDQAAANGFEASICYEEKTCFPDWARNRAGIHSREDAIQFAIRDFRYLKTQFAHPAYYRRDGKPVVMVFGFVYPRPKGWGEANGEWRFTPEEWRRILKEADCEEVELLLQQFRYQENGFNTFLWRHPDEFYPKGKELVDTRKLAFFIGSVCHGFDDRGTNGWDHGSRVDPGLGLERLEEFIAYADASPCDTIQLVTWNDFAEGTCFEPTFQYGQLHLERIARWSAERNQRPYQPNHTILPYQWFVLTKQFGPEATIKIKESLRKENYTAAQTQINELCAEKKFKIPSYIGKENEFPIYQTTSADAAASKPDVPKEKFLLILLAGQSNMAGRGEITEADRHPDDRILMLNAQGVWVPAVDPVHFDKPSAGVGPGRAFARKLAEAHPDAVIGLIPAAVGNSALSQFQPGAVHPETGVRIYDDLIARTRRAMQDGTLTALLFHHGESALHPDAAANYQRELTELIDRLRADLNQPELPVLVGEIRYREGSPENQLLNNGIRDFSLKDRCSAFVSTQDLTFQPDQVHFDRNSQITLGERYYDAYVKRLAEPCVAQPENLLPADGFVPDENGTGLTGYRIEVQNGKRAFFQSPAPGVVEIRPENGKTVSCIYSPIFRLPAGTALAGSIRVKGSGIFRFYATSADWKPAAAWNNKAFVASELLQPTGEFQTFLFRFVSPGENLPFRFRFDIDSSGPVQLSRPKLVIAQP